MTRSHFVDPKFYDPRLNFEKNCHSAEKRVSESSFIFLQSHKDHQIAYFKHGKSCLFYLFVCYEYFANLFIVVIFIFLKHWGDKVLGVCLDNLICIFEMSFV